MTDNNSIKKIPLTQGKFATVDAEDYEYISQWKWYYSSTGYAARSIHLGMFNCKQKQKIIYMHRIINTTPEGMDTDHIDMDKLNNQKKNLRGCSRSQNNMNMKGNKNTSSKYRGVYWVKERKKWSVNICKDKYRRYIGSFTSEEKAGEAYNKAALEHFGEFAKLNII